MATSLLSEVMSIALPPLWPMYHLLYLFVSPESAFKAPMRLTEYAFEWSPKFLFIFNINATVYILVSYFSFKYTFPDLDQPINWGYWIPVIIIRDLVITWIIYETWHYSTYLNKSNVQKLSNKKFNPKMPDERQWSHDRFWSLSGTVIAALHEVLMIYLWSTGFAGYYLDFWAFPMYSVFWTLFQVWWRHFHFYFAHRGIHPWFHRKSSWKRFDLGQWLYDNAHSLHHKSYNPGPWSGLRFVLLLCTPHFVHFDTFCFSEFLQFYTFTDFIELNIICIVCIRSNICCISRVFGFPHC